MLPGEVAVAEVFVLQHVVDFLCHPDGRFLEQVSISAGSAALVADGGTLRRRDIGKHISIPGADNLVGTIPADPHACPDKGRPNLCACECRATIAVSRKFVNQKHYSAWLSHVRVLRS
jgi:hypothetical protein